VCFLGLIVLLSLQFLTPLFKYIPDASLAVVVILAVLDMVTFHKVWIFWSTRSEYLIFISAADECNRRIAYRTELVYLTSFTLLQALNNIYIEVV